MRRVWRGIVRTLFWAYERGTWPYDLMVLAILLFLFVSPRAWFRDQLQVGAEAHPAQVRLLEEDASRRTRTYRLDVHLLAPPGHTPELERETHEILRKNVDELRGHAFQIVRIEAGRAEDGTVLYYDVSVKE